MSEPLFENLSSYKNLTYFLGNGPDDLLLQLKTIRLPYRIIAMYAVGSKHIVWFESTAPIKKVKKGD